MALTGKQKRTLRAEGIHLKPEVLIGKEGISDGTIQTIENCFKTKELVKIKLLDTSGLDKHGAGEVLQNRTKSELVQIVGHTILLYKELFEEKD